MFVCKCRTLVSVYLRVTFVLESCCDKLNFQFTDEIEVKCQGPKKDHETVGMQPWRISNFNLNITFKPVSKERAKVKKEQEAVGRQT